MSVMTSVLLRMNPKVTWKLDDLVGSGTSYRGMIVTTYDKLVEVFGEPNRDASDKVFNEWAIEFRVPIEDDGMGDVDDYDTVDATIYDWKEPHGSVSHYGEYNWHIGGRGHQCVELVYEALGK